MFRLKAMIRDGQLLQNRKNAFALISKLDLIKGRIQGNKDGFGFLIPDDGGEDLYLSPREMRQLFDGDRAVVRESGTDHRGRKEGQLSRYLNVIPPSWLGGIMLNPRSFCGSGKPAHQP